MTRQRDAVVIGAGIVGAACARELARSGMRVTVLDRGASSGGTSSHGEGNLLVSDKAPGPELDLALHAAAAWERTARELHDELGPVPAIEHERKGGLVVATTTTGAEALTAFADRQRAAGVTAHALAPAEARGLEPALTEAVTAAVLYPDDAQLQPVAATEALLASARRAGAEVRQGVRVTGALTGPGGAVAGVRTTAGDVHAPLVVLAAGPWTGEISALLGAPIPIHPRRGFVLVTARMPHTIRRKVYDADYVGAVGSGDAALQTSSVVESTAAGTVLIGSSRQRVGFDDGMRVDVLAELAAKAVRLFPFLAGTPVLRAYGGFRPFAPDHLPVIGPDPRLPGLWHASGHEGAGIGLSVSTARLLADGVLGREPQLDPAPFRPDRAALGAAADAEEVAR